MSDDSTLYLRFGLHLTGRRDVFERSLLFNQWFPNGTEDAITLKTDDKNATLRVWFERDEYSTDDFEPEDGESTEDFLERVAIVGSGPLRGKLTLAHCKDDVISSLSTDPPNSTYEQLGKRVVRLLDKPLCRFVQLIRFRYGQYWIPELHSWNSEDNSLGSHCQSYHLRWSTDEENWTPFVPTPAEHRGVLLIDTQGHSYKAYLSADDWQAISEEVDEYLPSISEEILSKAHQAADSEEFDVAFVFAVSALDITLAEFF